MILAKSGQNWALIGQNDLIHPIELSKNFFLVVYMFVDPENGESPNAPNRVPRVRGDIGECPKPKKGACLLIKVILYLLILVKKLSKMPVSELIFHTWLLVNQN